MDVKEFTSLLTQGLIDNINQDEDINLSFKENYTYHDLSEYSELNNDGVPMDLVETYLLLQDQTITTDKGVIKLEKSVGGDEGDGSYVQRVLSITNGDKKEYFACEGYYSSWIGIEWDSFNFVKVKPREKTIVEYLPE